MFGDNIWAFVVVGGFIILGAVLAFAKMSNQAKGGDEPVEHDGPPPNFGETTRND